MCVCAVPGAPGSLTLTEVSSEPVGLLAEWSEVAGVVTGYKVEVSLTGRGGSHTFSSSDTSFTVTSEAVGGYEPVSVQVVAVNSVGSGPPSSPETGITPPIRKSLLVLSISAPHKDVFLLSPRGSGRGIRRPCGGRQSDCLLAAPGLPQRHPDWLHSLRAALSGPQCHC